jgi:hypothetical protein
MFYDQGTVTSSRFQPKKKEEEKKLETGRKRRKKKVMESKRVITI